MRKRAGFCKLNLALVLVAAFLASAAGVRAEEELGSREESAGIDRAVCVVDFFQEPGCAECRRIRNEVLPELRARLDEDVTVRMWDVTTKEGYQRRLRYQEALDITSNESSLAVVNGKIALSGWSEIREELIPTAEMILARHLAGEQPAAEDTETTTSQPADADVSNLALRQLHGFSALGVAIAGLADGINPCAIATLVFLISMLAALRVRGRMLLLTGGAFCVATFLTYFAIGFGLLSVLDSLAGIGFLQLIVEGTMVLVLGVLAVLSFGDAWRYSRTGRADAVMLKLPERGQRLVRRVVRSQFRRRNLLAGGFVAGAVVTAVESVCTGQVYVPTLVYLLRVRQATGPALGYLVLYNLMFLIPLVLAFGLAYAGLETDRFLRFSRQNVVVAKILLGILFVILAVAIFLM
ncbi:MAG: cytochrome c biogenesis CcdA family protein [Verrucomicrobiota bacterium]